MKLFGRRSFSPLLEGAGDGLFSPAVVPLLAAEPSSSAAAARTLGSCLSRNFHTASYHLRKKNKRIRLYRPNHPTRDSMSEALYELRKESQEHNVYHPDEVDFGGFLKSLPEPRFEEDIGQKLDQGIPLLELIPKSNFELVNGIHHREPDKSEEDQSAEELTVDSSAGLSAELAAESEAPLDGPSSKPKKKKAKKSKKSKKSKELVVATEEDTTGYEARLQAWIRKYNIPSNDVNTLFRTFVHPNWLAHCFSQDPFVRNIINRVSNQKLAQKGSDLLNFIMQSYMTAHTEHNTGFLQHYEENRSKMTLLMYNDPLRFQDYMTHDLKELHRRMMSNEALAYVADQLELKSLLLSHFSIVEELEISEDDLLPRGDPEYMVFPASKKASIDSHELILKANLVEALIGAIHLDSGAEVATQFVVDRIRPLLYEYVYVIDRMDYVRELQELLKQFRSHVDFRALKDPVNRGEVKVGVFIGTRFIDSAFGETFAIAKYRAAQKVYLDLKHNPVRIKQLEDSLVNQGYIQSLHFLKLQRIRDCMEFVPGGHQQVSRKQYKVNKNDISFYIQNRYSEKL